MPRSPAGRARGYARPIAAAARAPREDRMTLPALFVWIKALHVVSVIAWMAGLLYLPRLFVYHASAKPGSELSETLKIMERRLLRAIMNPAMIAAYVFGGWMLWDLSPAVWGEAWLWVKLAGVTILTAAHHYNAAWMKAFARDANLRSAGFYRIANEVPTLAMILIVFMVVVKPF
jgi:protoporphyrinogen IX oxidase